MEYVEKAPAKLNLCLNTNFRHYDGKPNWEMVMIAVDLADYLTLTPITTSSDIIVETDSGFLPCDDRNLAYQAAALLQEKFNIKQGVKISIDKNIPVCAGMGGGSADAAAVLRGLNNLWGLNLSLEQLAQIALEIDSDVPFCVYSRPATVTGKGEIIEPLENLPSMWIVIAKVKTSVSTPKILKQINYDNLNNLQIKPVVNAIQEGDFNKLCIHMGNCLEEVTAKKCPEIIKIKEKMIEFGAEAAVMSGTGPTIFGICKKQRRAQHIYNSLKGFCKEVYLVRPINTSAN